MKKIQKTYIKLEPAILGGNRIITYSRSCLFIAILSTWLIIIFWHFSIFYNEVETKFFFVCHYIIAWYHSMIWPVAWCQLYIGLPTPPDAIPGDFWVLCKFREFPDMYHKKAQWRFLAFHCIVPNCETQILDNNFIYFFDSSQGVIKSRYWLIFYPQQTQTLKTIF